MATFDPKSRTERKEFDSVKDLTNQDIKQVPSDATYRRRKQETANVGEGGNRNPAPSDINRQ